MQKLKFKNIALLIFFILAGLSSLPAQDIQLLQKADSLFEKRRYTQSLELYQEVLRNGKHSPAMLLKMSFISEGLERPEEALLYLNLYYVQTGDERVAIKISELAEENNLSGYELSGNELLGLLIYRQSPMLFPVLSGLAILLLGLMFYQRRKMETRPVIPGIFLLFIIAGIFFISNFKNRLDYGIITDSSSPIMSGPSPASKLISITQAGHRVRIYGKEDVWIKIGWNGNQAYIHRKHLRSIQPYL